MKGSCTVPRCETLEILKLTKVIDGAVVNVLASLAGHNVAQDLVRDLTEIASASLYVRGVAEQALEKPSEPVGVTEVHASTPNTADDPVALARSMQQRRHGGGS